MLSITPAMSSVGKELMPVPVPDEPIKVEARYRDAVVELLLSALEEQADGPATPGLREQGPRAEPSRHEPPQA